MLKILVVVAEKDQAVAAIGYLMEKHLAERGSAPGDTRVLILNMRPAKQPWQQRNTPGELFDSELQRQNRYIRNATLPWLNEAGIACETRICFGDVVDAVAKVVAEEGYDEVLIAEPKVGRIARLLERVVGVRPSSYLDRILPSSPVPVIVVRGDDVAVMPATGPAKPRRTRKSAKQQHTPELTA